MSTVSDPGITRQDALTLLKAHLGNDRLVAHCLASEAIMRSLARRFDENPEVWGLAGLLHDLDYEMTGENSARHGLETERILKERGVADAVVTAIVRHNAEGLGLERISVFDHALTCAETVTGMIVATARVYPDKKLASVKPSSVTKRMKTPHFARAVSRERILECEKIGIPLADFVALSLEAMTGIASEIGL